MDPAVALEVSGCFVSCWIVREPQRIESEDVGEIFDIGHIQLERISAHED